MNILLMHTHDTGKYISPYGFHVPTGHLMEFAKDAMVFEAMFCASPTCSPSRGAMMTSQYSHCNGLNGLSQRGHDITEKKHHMASYLHEHGYHSILAGVQHERDFLRPLWRAERASRDLGYDTNLSVEDTFVANDTDLLEWDWRNAERVRGFLDSYDGSRPFFLSYGTHATHRIYPELSDEDRKQYDPNYIAVPGNVMNNQSTREDTARLHKSLASYDRCFGRVMQGLKESGLYDQTIIIYTTDHGLPNPYSKCGLKDAGMAVSFIMRVPGFPQSMGRVYDGLLSQIDLLPTLCSLCGLPVPGYAQGRDFSAVFKDPGVRVRDEVFAEVNFHASYEPQRCIRTDRYKYIEYYDNDWKQYNLANCDESVIKQALVEGGIMNRQKAGEQLYDLLFDPNEMENLNSHPDYATIKNELAGRLKAWREETGDHIMTYEDYGGRYKVNRKTCAVASSKNSEDYESVIGR